MTAEQRAAEIARIRAEVHREAAEPVKWPILAPELFDLLGEESPDEGAAPAAQSAGQARGGVPAVWFDDYSTYAVDLTPGDGEFAPQLTGQRTPYGQINHASFFILAAKLDDPAFTPPIPEAELREVAMMDARRSRALVRPRLSRSFLGWRQPFHRRFRSAPGETIVVQQDFYLESLETQVSWMIGGYEDGLNVMQVVFGGPAFAFNAQDLQNKPVFLFRIFDEPAFMGSWHPVGPGLPGAEARPGEWFTVAVRVTPDDLRVYWRNSGTDGSRGVLIDDPDDIPGFEEGWLEVFPGQDRVLLSDEGGLQVWAGAGRATDEVYGARPGRPQAPAYGTRCDHVWTIARDPNEEVRPVYAPGNVFFDNLRVDGPAWPLGDVDGDGVVGAGDVSRLLSAWETPNAFLYDLDGDRRVNSRDLAVLLGQWGQ